MKAKTEIPAKNFSAREKCPLLSKTDLVFVCLVLSVLPSSLLAGLITVDSTGISIGPDSYPLREDLIVPDASVSPFFSLALGGVSNGLLSRRTPPGTHSNFDGSAVFMDGVTGPLGTYTWIISIPAGGFQFVDISGLPPEPFSPAGFLLSTMGTLVAVTGPGLTADPLVGTTGWHNKIVLTGPFVIPGGMPLSALPNSIFAASAWHVSMDALASYHSSSPEPGTLSVCGVALMGLCLKYYH